MNIKTTIEATGQEERIPPSVNQWKSESIDLLCKEGVKENKASLAINRYIEAIRKQIKFNGTGYGEIQLKKLQIDAKQVYINKKQVWTVHWIAKNNPFFVVLEKGNPLKENYEIKSQVKLMIAAKEKQEDCVQINIESLKQYIEYSKYVLRYKSDDKSQRYINQIKENIKTATAIYKEALIYDGELRMEYTPSAYGRKYYTGVNLQNCAKIVRMAALGDCVELDLRSAVYAVKYMLAQEASNYFGMKFSFGSTGIFLEHKGKKNCIIKKITDSLANGEEWKHKMFKEAFTAISFGGKGVASPLFFGHNKTLAINSIIQNKEIREQFLEWKHPTLAFSVNSLIEEQKVMTDLIVFWARTVNILPDNIRDESREQIIAWLYQHIETNIMNKVIDHYRKYETGYLMHVHDAIYVRNISDTTLTELNYDIVGNLCKYTCLIKTVYNGEFQ